VTDAMMSLNALLEKTSDADVSACHVPVEMQLFVAEPMPCLRQTSAVGVPPSCSFKIPMIWASVNSDRFIVRLLAWGGHCQKLEEIQGLRSANHGAENLCSRSFNGVSHNSLPGSGLFSPMVRTIIFPIPSTSR
jgi:hypothetical protein